MSLLDFYFQTDNKADAKATVDTLWRTTLLKWIVPTVVGIIVCTDLVVKAAHAENTVATANETRAEQVVAPATATTTLVDGPTGFVFVYTVEGWKFVPGSGAKKI